MTKKSNLMKICRYITPKAVSSGKLYTPETALPDLELEG